MARWSCTLHSIHHGPQIKQSLLHYAGAPTQPHPIEAQVQFPVARDALLSWTPQPFYPFKKWRLPPSVAVVAVVCTFIWTLRALWSSPLSGGWVQERRAQHSSVSAVLGANSGGPISELCFMTSRNQRPKAATSWGELQNTGGKFRGPKQGPTLLNAGRGAKRPGDNWPLPRRPMRHRPAPGSTTSRRTAAPTPRGCGSVPGRAAG